MKTKTKNSILIIVCTIIATIIPALILSKWIEAIIFVVCHTLIRNQFPKQYHHIIPYMCRLISSLIFFFGTCIVLPLQFSLFSAVVICYVVSVVGFQKRDLNDTKALNRRLQERIDKLQGKTIWQMNKEQLQDFLYSKGIRDEQMEFVVMILINRLTYEEMSDRLGYSVPTLKLWSKKCKSKLKIKSWKQNEN